MIFSVLPAWGSSPHTRGARSWRRRMGSMSRIIPAYAGSTEALYGARPGFVGSSPHTRGARDVLAGPDRHLRIIPAYAGSTIKGLWDGIKSGGSSPHTRGALPWTFKQA